MPPLREARPDPAPVQIAPEEASRHLETRIVETPKAVAGPTVAGQETEPGNDLTGEPIQLNINDLPLPVFINKVYGDLLGLSFSVEPELKAKKDLVTLRLTEPLPPADLFRVARTVLADYGVAIVEESGLLRFKASKTVAGDSVPLMVSGRALPEVPPSHRPIFQLVQLKAVRNNNVRSWLVEALGEGRLKVIEDANRNAIWLKGPRDQVKQALEIIALLDQPLLKGRHSIAVEPVFWSPTELAGALEKVLKSEGYEVSQQPPFGAILLLPLDANNQLIAFATDRQVLNHVVAWAKRLDERTAEKGESGIYFYHAQSTEAEGLVAVLQSLGVADASMPAGQGNPEAKKVSAAKPAATSNKPDIGKLVIDKNLNAIIYRGDSKNWRQILTVLEQLDKPAAQVLVEVLVAEITRTDTKKTGVAWLIEDIGVGELNGTLGFGDLESSVGGISLVLDSAGETRALLSALYSNDRAVIRSSPRIMVKSGEEANIDVGTEIPIITSQNSSLDAPQGNINQNIQYRKTGVLLKVAPVVQGDGVVQLKISQELSQQTESATSGIDSPSIYTRSLDTTLSLEDGGSVLLGGMISTNTTDGTTKVPVLGDIPWLGRLFRSDSEVEVTTELVIMVIPYILREGQESQAISEAFRSSLQMEP